MAYDDSTTANRPPVYTVVFAVDLAVANSYPSVNENQTAATLATTRSTWIPQGPHGDETRVFKHGDQITAYDEHAVYLKNRYVYNATTNPYGVLTIVSETE